MRKSKVNIHWIGLSKKEARKMFVVVCFVPVSLFTVLASVVDWNLTVAKGPIQVKSSSSMAVYSAWHTPVYLLYTMMMLKSMLNAWMFLVCLIFFSAFSAICFSHIYCLFWSLRIFRASLLLLFFRAFFVVGFSCFSLLLLLEWRWCLHSHFAILVCKIFSESERDIFSALFDFGTNMLS